MSSESINYSAVLADMEAKRSALDAAIAGLRIYLAGNTGGPVGQTASAVAPTAVHNGEVPAGAFLGKSIPDAAKLYLQIVKHKATSREIAEALRRGGIESTSSKFQGIVHAVLDRARKAGGDLVKTDRSHWGLAEWYPAGVRITQSSDKIGKKHKKRGRPKGSGKKSLAKQQPITEPFINTNPQEAPRNQQKVIENWFLANLDREVDAPEVARTLNLRVQTVALITGKLAHQGWLQKTASGTFVRARSGDQQMPLAG